MEVIETPLPGLMVLKPVRHGDARGFFSESWNRQRMQAAGLDLAARLVREHTMRLHNHIRRAWARLDRTTADGAP